MIEKYKEKNSRISFFCLIAYFLLFLCGTSKACISPTTAASALKISHTGCNSVKLSWTSGNGNKRIVVVYPGAVTLPTSGATYAHSFVYTSGGALGTGHVVYDSTGNSVVILGLSASTTYTFEVYEYNTAGTCYLTPGTSITKATDACTTCPQITGIMIDACDDHCSSDPDNTGTASGNCCEGNAEFIILSTGSYGWDNNGTTLPSIEYLVTPPTVYVSATTFANETSPITTLNSSCGCAAGSFVDASAGNVAIPAWTNVMIGISNYPSDDFCPNNYTFTSLCAAMSPLYCLFATDANIRYSGNFDNYASSSAPREFYADFSKISASCSVQYYQYDAHLEGNGDGASISFSAAVSTNIASPLLPTYNPLSCGNQPIDLLPVKLISFTANYNSIANNVELEWVTATETNNKTFTLQKSKDGNVWENITSVSGAGNSNTNRYYKSVDEEPFEDASYYRLQQTDYDGHNTISNTIVSVNVPSQNKPFEIIPNPGDKSVFVSFHSQTACVSSLNIYDLAGKLVDSKSITSVKGMNSIELNTVNYSNGMYFIVVTGQEQQYSDKLLIKHL
jgi:hypothetical protein